MKNFKYFLASLLLCLSLNSNADDKDIFGEIHVSVNGLVCDFCAQSIQKLFNKEESVEAVDINMDEGMIKIDLKDGHNMDDNLITKLITDSGYNVERIYRVE
tara:strand:+ start:822 stop:1127 length:306 start_codon:yes stop_codon:yes gene_type:complete